MVELPWVGFPSTWGKRYSEYLGYSWHYVNMLGKYIGFFCFSASSASSWPSPFLSCCHQSNDFCSDFPFLSEEVLEKVFLWFGANLGLNLTVPYKLYLIY